MDLGEHLEVLNREATQAGERRMLVIQGEDADVRRCLDRVTDWLESTDGWISLGSVDGPWHTLEHQRSSQLLGRTIPGLIIDLTSSLSPNVIGQSIGAVEAGGLIILLIDSPDQWVAGPLESDRRIAIHPYDTTDVTNRFRRRFYQTLESHPGISIVHAEHETVVVDGTTGPRSPPPTCTTNLEGVDDLEPSLAAACATTDQRNAVAALSRLEDRSVAVIESHRGRGKSAAAGIAAAGFARNGAEVVVTGPGRSAVTEVFSRAASVLDTVVIDDQRPSITTGTGGTITYHRPYDLEAAIETADVLFVDEAAAIPVDRLRDTLEASIPVGYLTTVHGYEGTGRGFAVRFQETLEQSDRHVTNLRLDEPIRYRQGDPIEIWQFRALLLDASPPADDVVDTAEVGSADYVRIDRDSLLEDEATLRELFGLLVLAHYRTEPDDLLRFLDAPNVSVRALYHEGHPVSVALLAEEGSLDRTWCERLHAGESIRGHMLPDLLITQLRDQDAGSPAGIRFLRIATHGAVRSTGFGSRLVLEIHDEFEDAVDWFGAGFGATTRLVSFWATAGYRPVHVGTSRNPRSGEQSVILMHEASTSGTKLIDRHERRLLERLPSQFPDALADLDPHLIESVLTATTQRPSLAVPEWMWKVVEATVRGPGQVATAPEVFARLTLAGLADGIGDSLTEVQLELLVGRTLQVRPMWTLAAEQDLTLGDARAALREAIATLWNWRIAR